METKWRERSVGINERFVKLAQAKGKLTSDTEMLNFLALAICGEAGELANLFKKNWRGEELDAAQVQGEIADIRIYLEHMCRYLNIDIDQACDSKLDEVAQRLAIKERNA